jgi:hypothetical protein
VRKQACPKKQKGGRSRPSVALLQSSYLKR